MTGFVLSPDIQIMAEQQLTQNPRHPPGGYRTGACDEGASSPIKREGGGEGHAWPRQACTLATAGSRPLPRPPLRLCGVWSTTPQMRRF